MALRRLEEFEAGEWGRKYPTNAIESLNMHLRKIIKNRGHFPSDEAASKLL